MTRDEVLAIIKQAEEDGWEELDLSGQGLRELPKEIGRLTRLKVLKLGYNKETRNFNNLQTLPDSLAQLTNLQSLDIRSNKLGTLPEWLAQLSNLQSLDISNNNLGTLPEWLAQLTNLQSLDLSYNNLGTLPKWLAQLTNLQSLGLRYNNLETLPEWLAQLSNLQTLDLRENNLRLVVVSRLINFFYTGHKNYPLAQLTNLKSLFLGGNKLGTLPKWLAQLTNLQSLDIGYNNLETLPEGLTQLTNLQTLFLGGNNLGTLPEWLTQLTNLQSLDIGWNNLWKLPEWLAQLSNLQSLDLSSNKLGTLPEWLAQLSNLQSLDILNNRLRSLPEWLAQLSNLQSLDSSSNNLETLPEWLAQLSNLQHLYIYNNPITEPSPEVLGEALTDRFQRADLEAIRRYYAQLRQEGEEVFYEAKLLIIGEGGAGKTSLARKLKEPDQPLHADEASTEGIVVSVWNFTLPDGYEQKQYRVNIWDFGGQEVYHATHQFFLTKRSVYVLVADARREDADFYTWLRMQETFGGGSPVILVKNQNRKTVGRFNLQTLADLQAAFPNLQEAIDLDLDNVPDNQEWPRLLQKLEGHFLGLEHVGQPRPKTWVRVREALNERPEDTISQDDYLALCREQGVKADADALQLSEYLHNLGDILHFQQDRLLENTVILKPTWGLDAVYRVLDNQAIVDNKGQFSYSDLRQLWHEPKYRAYHNQLLRLMEKFQLCYRLDGRLDTFIAPQLLENKRPNYDWETTHNLRLRYRYPHFMPRGIVSRAIVKLHHRIEDQALVWQSGAVLNDGYARAEMIARPEIGEIQIRISGSNKRDLLMEIVRALEELHQSFPNLDYQKLIPCNCAACQDNAAPHFFELDNLRLALSKGVREIQCYQSFEQINIRSLLSDGYEGLERPGVVQNFYGDYVGGSMFKDIGISDVSGSAVSFGDEGSAMVD